MQRYTDYDRELQDVVRQLAAVTQASASEKKHDARMATIATNAAATIREVLERNARRARLYSWVAGGVSVAIALVAMIVVLSMDRSARDMKQSYDRALARATTESSVLQAQLVSSQQQWKVMRKSRIEDRSMLSSTLEKLANAYDSLVETTSLLASATTFNLDHKRSATLAAPDNTPAKLQPMSAAMTQSTSSLSRLVEEPDVRKTRSAKVITKLKSSASRRLVDAMRSQRREARGQVEELFAIYPNNTGSCITSR